MFIYNLMVSIKLNKSTEKTIKPSNSIIEQTTVCTHKHTRTHAQSPTRTNATHTHCFIGCMLASVVATVIRSQFIKGLRNHLFVHGLLNAV